MERAWILVAALDSERDPQIRGVTPYPSPLPQILG